MKAAAIIAALGIALIVTMGPAPSSAQTSVTLIGNSGQTASGAVTLGFDLAQAFTTGSNSAGYKLTSVQVFIGTGGSPPGHEMKIMNDDGSGKPGSTKVGTLTGPSTLGTGLNDFTGDVDLDASTTYHVVMDLTATSTTVTWGATSSDDEDSGGAAGWSIANGANWRAANDTGSWTGLGSTLRIVVNGNAKVGPTLLSATVKGAALKLNYNKALDTGSVPASGAFTVTVAGSTRTLSSRAVAGSTVTLTLSSAVTAGQTVTVTYTAPAVNPIQDTDGVAAAALSNHAVTNVTGDSTVPTFSSATVDGTELVVTFSEAMNPAGNPASSVFRVTATDSGGTSRNIDGTTADPVTIDDDEITVTLSSAVAVGETVTVAYRGNALGAGKKVRDHADNNLADFSGQSVTNVTGSPTLSSATVDGTSLVLNYSEALDTASTPATTDFTVSVAGTNKTPSDVEVAGSAVTLTLATADAVTAGQTVTVSYTVGANPIKDLAGNDAAALSTQAVTNNTQSSDMTNPTISGATVDGTSLVLNYNEALDTGSTPATTDFTVTVAGADQTPTAVVVSGQTVTLTLGTAATAGQTVTVSYTKGTNPIRDEAGNDAADLSSQSVTNLTGVLVSNTGQPVVASKFGFTADYAQAFTTGSHSSGYTLTSVELNLASTGTQAIFTVTLHADSSGTPSTTSLGTLTTTTTTLPSTFGLVQFDAPGTGISLTAGTTYWVVIDVTTGSNTTELQRTTSNNQDSGGATGWSIADTFRWRLAANTTWTNTDTNPIHIRVKGATGTLTDTTNPTISGAPAVTSAAGADNTYAIGDTISVKVTFSENVTVTGTPQLEIAVGSNNRQANYASGTGSTELTFSYAVAAGDADSDGIAVAANKLTLNGGTIKDAADNHATLTHAALAAQSGHKVDGVRPTVSGSLAVTSNPGSDGTYIIDDTIEIEVTFSEDVNVTGTPQLALTIGTTTKQASYTATAGDVLEFTYDVVAGDLDADGFAVAANALALNGGTIKDDAGNDATLTHTALAASATQKVDGVVPTVSSATVEAASTSLVITFSETLGAAGSLPNSAFTVKKTPAGGMETTVTLSSTAPSISGDTVTLTLGAAVVATDTDVKVTYAGPTSGTNNKIKDAAGNEAANFTDQSVTITDPVMVSNTGQTASTATFTFAADRAQAFTTGSNSTGYTLTSVEMPMRLASGTESNHTVAIYADSSGAPAATSLGTLTRATALTSTFSLLQFDASGSGISLDASTTYWVVVDLSQSGLNMEFQATAATDQDSGGATGWTIGDSHRWRGVLATMWGSGTDTNPVQIRVRGSANAADTTNPTISGAPSVTSSPGTGSTYIIGDTISLKVTFDENVTVTGTPQLEIAVGSNNRQANYASGTGTTELTFSYTVVATDADSDGISVAANKLTLNGGTIQDAASNNATLTHTALAAQSGHKVDGVVPTVSGAPSVTSAAGSDNTYAIGDTISVKVTFSENVTVDTTDGTPQLEIAVGSNNRQANYASGTGSTELTFSYTVASGDADSDGIAVAANKLTLHSGTIQDAAGNNATLTHAALAAQSGHKVDGVVPTVLSATVEAASTSLVIKFSETLGAAASLANSSFTVKKTPQNGSETTVSLSSTAPSISGDTVTLTLAAAVVDTDSGVKVTYAKPTSGTNNKLKDAAGNEAAGFADQSVTITDPVLVSNTGQTADSLNHGLTVDSAQAFTTGSNSAGYTLTSVQLYLRSTGTEATYSVTLHADSSGTPSTTSLGTLTTTTALTSTFALVQFDASGNGISLDANKTYWVVIDVSAVGSSTTYFRATSSDDEDSGGATGWSIANVYSWRGFLSTSWTTGVTTQQSAIHIRVNGSVDVDTTVPTLASATVDGTSLVLNYSEALDTTSTPATSDFTVSVAGTDQTPTGVSVAASSVTLTLGTAATAGQTVTVSYTKGTNRIQDLSGNDAADLSSQSVTNVTGDTTAPTVSGAPSVTSAAGSDNTYAIGDTISVKVTFSEVVTVTGTPQLEIAVGSNNRQANYASGTGSTELTFSYTVVAGDADSDGIAVAADKLTLNGGTIQDAASNNATLTHAALAAQSSHKVDGVKPTVSGAPSVTSAAGSDNTYAIGDTISVKVTFNENVTVTGTPRLVIAVGANNRQANYASGSGSTELTFSYTVASGDADSDGIAVAANKLTLNGGTIKDAAGNSATLTHVALAAQSTHKVDGVRPTFSSATVNGTSLVVTFSEAMNTAGNPASSVFRVNGSTSGDIDGSGTAVTINGDEITVTLASAVLGGETVTVAYRGNALGAGNKVRDLPGNNLADFSGGAVTNNTPDTTAPTLDSATVSGSTLTLNYNEALDTGSTPATTDFTVSVAGTDETPTGVAVSGSAVMLTLGTAATPGQTVTVSYTVGTNPIRDQAQNNAAALSTQAVTNNTPAPPPVSQPSFGGGGGGGGGGPSPSVVDYEWTVKHDIEALARGNDTPTGMWSDGTTIWMADNGQGADDEVYAYDLVTGERVDAREFALDSTNRAPRGFWSNGETVWVSDSGRDHVFAYDLAGGGRLEAREIALETVNRDARGIWSDGETLWVLDGRANALFAYDLASGRLLAHYELDSRNGDPRGTWSDGTTVWVSDHGAKILFAYRLPEPPPGEDQASTEAGEVQAASNHLPEPVPLERVRDEEFTHLSSSSNNSPRGIWSDGVVMYVTDQSDGRVYTYNMPDAIDTRLASLSLSGVEIGEFDPASWEYEGTAGRDITVTTVAAEAMQRGTTVVIEPPDADEETDGHQVALDGLDAVTVTVTSADGSRTRVYRVQIAAASCLLGAVGEGFSLVVHEGGTVDELDACARDRAVGALYALHQGAYVGYFPDAPESVNRPFAALYADGVPALTPLVVASEGPPSGSPALAVDDAEPSWPECLPGSIPSGYSAAVYEGGSIEDLATCASGRNVAALYALHGGDWVPYVVDGTEAENQPFADLFPDGVPAIAPFIVKSELSPPATAAGSGGDN